MKLSALLKRVGGSPWLLVPSATWRAVVIGAVGFTVGGSELNGFPFNVANADNAGNVDVVAKDPEVNAGDEDMKGIVA